MKVRQAVDQAVFLMSGLYGILSNEDLKEAMETDVGTTTQDVISARYDLYQRCYVVFVDVFKHFISMDKGRKDIDEIKGFEAFEKALPICREKVMATARLAIRLIADLKKDSPRDIYKQSITFLMWTIEKQEIYGNYRI